MKIVVVDDENIIVKVLKMQLEFKDPSYEVQTFTSPTEALKFVREHDIDVCIVDYRMPEIDGNEFIKQVREFNKTIKTFVLTGVNSKPSEFYNENIDGYLIKPFKYEIFENILKEKGIKAYFEEEYNLKLAC